MDFKKYLVYKQNHLQIFIEQVQFEKNPEKFMHACIVWNLLIVECAHDSDVPSTSFACNVQGSHRHWKTWNTWKNEKTFSSQGKDGEFWKNVKKSGKSRGILNEREKSGKTDS